MSQLFRLLGVNEIAFGIDLDNFLIGITFKEDVVEEEPELKAVFVFIGPLYGVVLY